MELPICNSVFDIFEETLRDNISEMLRDVANKYGKRYGFTSTDLIEEFLPSDKILINVAKHDIEINKPMKKTKKTRRKTKSNKRNPQCIARTWSDGRGLQCTRQSFNNNEFCKTHLNQIENGKFWQGTINDSENKVAIRYKQNREKSKT